MARITCPCCHRNAEQPGDFLFDWGECLIATKHGEAKVRPTEADIFWLLVQKPGAVITHERIAARLDGASADAMSIETLRAHVCNLRRRVAHIGIKIENIHGRGYKCAGVTSNIKGQTNAR